MDQREKLAPPKPLRLTQTWQRSVSPASLLQFQVWRRCSSHMLPSGSFQKGPVHCWQQLWTWSWTIPDNCLCPLLDWALRARGLTAHSQQCLAQRLMVLSLCAMVFGGGTRWGIPNITDTLPSFDVHVTERKIFCGGDFYQIVERRDHWTHSTISYHYMAGSLVYQIGMGRWAFLFKEHQKATKWLVV